MLRAAICAAVVIGVGAGLLTAQAPVGEQREPVFRTSTSLVLLDVSLTDHKGRPIRNLEKGSFQIYEDGVEQEVAFSTTSSGPCRGGLFWIAVEA